MKPENKKNIYIVYATDKLLLLNLPLLHCLPRSLYSYFAFKEIYKKYKWVTLAIIVLVYIFVCLFLLLLKSSYKLHEIKTLSYRRLRVLFPEIEY